MNRAYLLAAASLTFCSCTSTLERPAFSLIEVEDQKAPLQYSDKDIEDAFSIRTQLRLPSRVAVARVQRNDAWNARPAGRLVTMGEEERKAWESTLRSPEPFSEVSFLTTLLTPAGSMDLRQLRYEAARLKSDLVLLYRLESDEDSHSNPLSILYLTIIGGLVVPGTVYENCTVGKAALVDSRNGAIYCVVEAEVEDDMTYPVFLRRDALETLRERNEKRVLEKLRAEVSGKIASLAK